MSAYFVNSLFKNYVISLLFFIIYHTNCLYLIFPSSLLLEKENGKQVQLFSKENEIMNRIERQNWKQFHLPLSLLSRTAP